MASPPSIKVVNGRVFGTQISAPLPDGEYILYENPCPPSELEVSRLATQIHLWEEEHTELVPRGYMNSIYWYLADKILRERC